MKYLLKLDRRLIASLLIVKEMLESLAGYSLFGTGVSGLGTVLAGTKIYLWLTIILAIAGAISLLIRKGISFIVSVSVIENPIDPGEYAPFEMPNPVVIPQPSDNNGSNLTDSQTSR